MNKASIIKRGLHALGSVLMVYGGSSAAQAYKTVRDYCAYILPPNEFSAPFAAKILESPETLLPHLLIIAAGFVILSLGDWVYAKLGYSWACTEN